MPPKSCRQIEALISADKILSVLAENKAPLTIAGIAKLAGLSSDVAFRQLGTMEEIGWADKIGDGFILGPRTALLWAKRKALLEDRIMKTTQELDELNGGKDGE